MEIVGNKMIPKIWVLVNVNYYLIPILMYLVYRYKNPENFLVRRRGKRFYGTPAITDTYVKEIRVCSAVEMVLVVLIFILYNISVINH